MSQTSEKSFSIPARQPIWQRLSWRAVVVFIMGAFVIGYPIYEYLDTMITGGIHHKGDLLDVDLKAMSSFEFDQSHGQTDDIPRIYRDLDGKRVELVGQMWDPYAADGKVCNFTLVYSIANCCFSGPPKVQHFVQATVVPGKSVDAYPDFVDVIGTLHVGVKQGEGKVQSVYRLDVEKVTPEK